MSSVFENFFSICIIFAKIHNLFIFFRFDLRGVRGAGGYGRFVNRPYGGRGWTRAIRESPLRGDANRFLYKIRARARARARIYVYMEVRFGNETALGRTQW